MNTNAEGHYSSVLDIAEVAAAEIVAPEVGAKRIYLMSKRVFDIAFCIFALPILAGVCVGLLVLNQFWNPGPLFFTQMRCGQNRRAFRIYKFRTMTVQADVVRGADDPVERSRITALGRAMRRTKLDELPQILNVLLGDMSVIGPRPEVFQFAEEYRREIPGYSLREVVKPGLTGYAQVMQGYTDSLEAVRRKTELDHYYVRNMGWKLDTCIVLKTIPLVLNLPKHACPAGE